MVVQCELDMTSTLAFTRFSPPPPTNGKMSATDIRNASTFECPHFLHFFLYWVKFPHQTLKISLRFPTTYISSTINMGRMRSCNSIAKQQDTLKYESRWCGRINLTENKTESKWNKTNLRIIERTFNIEVLCQKSK